MGEVMLLRANSWMVVPSTTMTERRVGERRSNTWPRMILGIGNDIIDIRRVEKSIERFGERFLSRVFTDVERAKSDRRAQRAASYAKRFAAKEACAKALGTGLNAGVFWRDMGVVNLPSGKPTLRLTGGALKRLQADHAAGHGGADRPHHHRRFSTGPGHRHHLRQSRLKPPSC